MGIPTSHSASAPRNDTIIGVLSVGGIAGYSKAMHRYKINKAIEQITLIAGNVRSFFAPQRSYEGLGYCWEKDNAPDSYKANCKLIKKAKLMPDEMWDDNDKRFNNVFGYSVQLYTINKSTDSDKQAFRIQYIIGSNGEKGNEERCIDLLTYDWTAANIGFISLYDSDIDLKVPVSVDNAINVCSDENNESISFFFDVDVKWYRTVDHDGYTWYD